MVEAKITPMMKQFLELKEQYSDCILLFRAGDFYETFYDDAKESAKILDITLTKRGETPMAGVPHHSIMPYIKKLLQHNKKVALCEQLEDPKQAKGLVKRGVTRVLTPGTVLEDDYMFSTENNYIMCLYQEKKDSMMGVSIIDISTGEFLSSEANNIQDIKTLINKYSPNEIILNDNFANKGLINYIKNSNIYHNYLSLVRFNLNYTNEILKKQFNKTILELGFDQKSFAIIACGAILYYIYKLQRLDLSHIKDIEYINQSQSLVLDSITLRNLDIIENLYLKDSNKTLFGILNNTKTAIGSRLFKKHLLNPLLSKIEIEKRLDAVEEANEYILQRDEIRSILDNFSDIERITSRISSSMVTPKDLEALNISLKNLPLIKENLYSFNSPLFKDIKSFEEILDITNELDLAIVDNAPSHTRDIGYLKTSYSKDLEELSKIAFSSKDFIRDLEEQQRITTRINTLKIKFNKISGYYIEIPKSQMDKVPENYQLRQTLVNGARYTNSDLKELELKILSAEEKIKIIELDLYQNLVEKLKLYIKKFQSIANKIALLDVILSNGLTAQLNNYIRPTFSLENDVLDARNPIVEKFTQNFVPNSYKFNENDRIKIITGPNSSGKSTYLRQIGLIIIMAQSGLYVPANNAILKIYDRVFTRIGAHDELAEGQSTFMVEMIETANILNNATKNSLVLLDEIGRGTSTYDGLAIAWAVVEDLNEKNCDTVFATHYHQLNNLENIYQGIKNYQVLVKEENGKIDFLRKIVQGGTDKSYGIYVGGLAGIPNSVLNRALEIQKNIESGENIKMVKPTIKKNQNVSNKSLGDWV